MSFIICLHLYIPKAISGWSAGPFFFSASCSRGTCINEKKIKNGTVGILTLPKSCWNLVLKPGFCKVGQFNKLSTTRQLACVSLKWKKITTRVVWVVAVGEPWSECRDWKTLSFTFFHLDSHARQKKFQLLIFWPGCFWPAARDIPTSRGDSCCAWHHRPSDKASSLPIQRRRHQVTRTYIAPLCSTQDSASSLN